MTQVATTTETAVANEALSLLRARAITDIDADTSNACTVAKKWFASTRDALQAENQWNFCKWYASLAASGDTPPTENWLRLFNRPADCLVVRKIEGCTEDDWEVIGTQIASNAEAPLKIVYTRRVPEVAKWSAVFRNVFAVRLARAMAPELAQDERIHDRLDKAEEAAWAAALPVDAGEGLPERIGDDAFTFLAARR